MTQKSIATTTINTLTAIPTVGQVVRYLGVGFRWLTPGKEYTIESIDEDGDAVFYGNDGDEMWVMEGNLDNFQLVDTAPLTELPQVGQVVIYVGPSRNYLTVGKAYEIIDIDDDGDAVFVDDEGDVGYVFEDELDEWEVLVEDAHTPTTTKPSEDNPLALALGDKVRILDASRIMGGSVSFKNGDITEVTGFIRGHVQLKPTLGDHDHLTLFGRECAFIEKYVPEVGAKEGDKFNVGDLVKIIDVDAIEFGSEHFDDGDIVEVADTTYDGGRPFLTGTKQGDTLYIMGAELHAIQMLPFKVGDKVTLKDTRGAMGGFEVGGTYPIIAVNYGGFHDFELRTPSGICGYANESSLELAKEKQNETGDEEVTKSSTKVQKGDKVRLTNTFGALIGFSVGELCEITDANAEGHFQVGLVSLDRPGRIGFADESSLELVTAPAQPLTKMPKKGDVVRASRVGVSRFVKEGEEYTILGVDEDGQAYYEGEDGVSDIDGANRIKEWFMDEFDLVSEATEVEAVATAPTCGIASEVTVLEARVDAMEKRLNALETGNVDITTPKAEMKAGGFRIISDSITLSGGTPNERRKAIIEKAKKFVATIQSEVRDFHEEKLDANALYNDFVTDSYFVVDAKKGTVEVIVQGARISVEYGRAIAKCNPEDVFNEYIGKAIAIGRVYGLDVSEFEMAVQPELAIGQEVETLYFSGGVNRGCPTTVTRLKNYGRGAVPGFDNGSHSSKFRITEDTNAQY